MAGKQIFSDVIVPAPRSYIPTLDGAESCTRKPLSTSKVDQKGKVFIQVEHTRDTDHCARDALWFHRSIEQQLVFNFRHAYPPISILAIVGKDFFTAVTGKEFTAIGESQALYSTLVFASLAVDDLFPGIFSHFMAAQAAETGDLFGWRSHSSRASSAAPYAPINSAISGQTAWRPEMFSNAL